MDFLMTELLMRIVECMEVVQVPANEWKTFYRVSQVILRFPKRQPQHVDEEEAEEIKKFKQ
jgi:hypothetical protein